MNEITNPDQLFEGMDEPPCFGYQIEQETHSENWATSMEPYSRWKASFADYPWEPPKFIDSRPWFRIDNQANTSSCVGNSGANQVEFCAMLANGEVVQLSRYFCYLASQEFGGGTNGDNGAYLGACSKAVRRGIPLESVFPFSTSYGSQRSKYRSELSTILAGDVWKCTTSISMDGWESCYRWLSGWTGCIQIGIGWSLSSSQWEVTSYRSGGGGHALVIPGYLERSGWPGGIGFLLMNSWGVSWNKEGWALIHPDVITTWCQRQTVIARSDMELPKPRVESIDFARAANFELVI